MAVYNREMDYTTFYSTIEKPFFAPPEWVFGAAWSLIYPLIAIAFFSTLFLWFRKRVEGKIVIVFIINLIANIAFTPILITWGSQLWATIDILVVLGTLIYLMREFWYSSRFIWWLLLPYLLWGAFATFLQATIYFLNR